MIRIKVKGVRDIKTHTTLAREGKLVSVARDWHKRGQSGSGGGTESSDWSVERHVFKKESANARRGRTAPSHYDLRLKARKRQAQVIQDQLREMEQAMAEGIPVAADELERLKTRLSQLGAER